MELRGFSGNYSKIKWSYVVFAGITRDRWLFRENGLRNEVIAFSHVYSILIFKLSLLI